MDNFDPSYLSKLSVGLSVLQEQAEALFAAGGTTPIAGSVAERELSTAPRPESIVTTCSVAITLLEYSAEHISAFRKTIEEPIEQFAALTTIRSMLEACSLVVWLCDPKIGPRDRVARVFGYRHEGLEQQLKSARSLGAAPADITKIENRIAQIEHDAQAAGYAAVVNKSGKSDGAGARVPNTTDLIKITLDEEVLYRILSALAHAQHWALAQLGYTDSGEAATHVGTIVVHRLEKTVNVKALALAGIAGITAFSLATWSFGAFVGWDRASLIAALDKTYDSLHIKESQRFWR